MHLCVCLLGHTIRRHRRCLLVCWNEETGICFFSFKSFIEFFIYIYHQVLFGSILFRVNVRPKRTTSSSSLASKLVLLFHFANAALYTCDSLHRLVNCCYIIAITFITGSPRLTHHEPQTLYLLLANWQYIT